MGFRCRYSLGETQRNPCFAPVLCEAVVSLQSNQPKHDFTGWRYIRGTRGNISVRVRDFLNWFFVRSNIYFDLIWILRFDLRWHRIQGYTILNIISSITVMLKSHGILRIIFSIAYFVYNKYLNTKYYIGFTRVNLIFILSTSFFRISMVWKRY